MRTFAVLIVLAGCDGVFGLHHGEPADAAPRTDVLVADADAGDGSALICANQPNDPLRYHGITADADYTQTLASCGALDMLPIVFDDELEIERQGNSLTPNYWTGIGRVGSGSDFIAIDGCMPVLDWAPGEPSDGPCVVVQSDLTLVTTACDNIELQFCETAPQTVACAAAAARVSGYTMLGSGAPVTHAAAQSGCAAAGMQLAEIDSSAEAGALATAVGTGQVWVAGIVHATNQWDPTPSGCPAVHAWAGGQPNLNGLDPACSLFDATGATEQLDACSNPHPAVCEPVGS